MGQLSVSIHMKKLQALLTVKKEDAEQCVYFTVSSLLVENI
jgi:hypothetical protein